MTQRTGWRDKAIKNQREQRKQRAAEIRLLQAQRVTDEHTAAEIEAIHRGMKQDTINRNPGWFA